jgi:RNA-directed DNA polymerase
MKRKGYLIEKIADMDNLRLAFYKAKKGKTDKKSVRAYQANLSANLLELRSSILTGEVTVGNYHYFKVFDPKERQICAAAFSERVLHHALMNICHDDFETFQIKDSFASRKGKGTYAALAQAAEYQKQYSWYLKLDVRKYFENIDHAILKEQLHDRYKDIKLLTILDHIIDSYHVKEGKGVPIGNLTSQYFANHYLALADHFIKEKLQAKAYVRYMDDMIIWDNDKNRLLSIGIAFENYCRTELNLELKPFCLNYNKKGLPFLGYLLFIRQIRLARRSRKRFVQKMKLYQQKLNTMEWTQKEYQCHIMPLIAFTEQADSKGFRRKVMENIEEKGKC